MKKIKELLLNWILKNPDKIIKDIVTGFYRNEVRKQEFIIKSEIKPVKKGKRRYMIAILETPQGQIVVRFSRLCIDTNFLLFGFYGSKRKQNKQH